ncbi:MAG: DciA family protein [Sphingomicrobium sp.]
MTVTMSKPVKSREEAPRQGRARATGEIIGGIGGLAFKRFGFVQSAVVSRWKEIVGERYARVSSPESIRFPTGKKSGGTLTLLVEGAHAPLVQHLGPMIIERVNRFFGYQAIAQIAFRQGRVPAAAPRPARTKPAPVELGEGIREIADPELRACLESLAGHIARSNGSPTFEPTDEIPIPIIRSKIT